MIQVSAIIPTYNRQNWVQQAIASALNQRDVTIECIVIDDGSTDETGNVLKAQYGNKIQYVFQPNAGVSTARNLGAALAHGKYLAFLDSDDYWLPHKTAYQVNYLEKNPDDGAVYCQAYAMNHLGKPILRLPYGTAIPQNKITASYVLLNGFALSGSTPMIRKTVFDQIGGFKTNIRHAEDTEIVIRMLMQGYQIGFVRRPMVWVRSHSYSKSLSIDRKTMIDAYLDHQNVYKSILAESKNPEILAAARLSMQRQVIKLLAYCLYSGDIEEAERLHQSAELPSNIPVPEYDRQIHFFTPLIYGEKLQPNFVIDFARTVFAFRDTHDQSPQQYHDTFEILRAAEWCARQSAAHTGFAWRQVFAAMRRQPGLLFTPAFWKLIARLLLGRLYTRLYLFKSHLSDD